jgi:hypothetical protein
MENEYTETKPTLYAKRDLEELGGHYLKHLNAMTSEQLHSKSDIAAELAARDVVIEDLTPASTTQATTSDDYTEDDKLSNDIEMILSNYRYALDLYGELDWDKREAFVNKIKALIKKK